MTSLFFTMFPFYILGNLHCLGMCGPLVSMIGQHRFKYCYFIGRLLSFSLAGMIAGELGSVLSISLKYYHIPEVASFLFGSIILLLGLSAFTGWRLTAFGQVSHVLQPINRALSILMLKDTPWATFFFGFFTVLLPCGQSLVVFSAIALAADPLIGFINGFALAFLTTPSLLFALQAHLLLRRFKKHYNKIMGICSIIIGCLIFCRGFAELGWIPHWVINKDLNANYHIVIF